MICEETVPTDCINRLFPNLILFQIFLFRLYIRKFVNSLLNYPQKISLQNFKPLFPLILRIFDLECHGQTSLKVDFVKFAPVFIKFRKLESLHMENKKLCNSNKKDQCRCFPVNFKKFLRILFDRTPLDDCFWIFFIHSTVFCHPVN